MLNILKESYLIRCQYYNDNRLDVFDLYLMKRKLIYG